MPMSMGIISSGVNTLPKGAILSFSYTTDGLSGATCGGTRTILSSTGTTSGSGTGSSFAVSRTVTQLGCTVSNISIAALGSGYKVNDTIDIPDGSDVIHITVTAVA